MFRYIWCAIFHAKHRYRSGERHIGRVSITYEIACRKCGNLDHKINWI